MAYITKVQSCINENMDKSSFSTTKIETISNARSRIVNQQEINPYYNEAFIKRLSTGDVTSYQKKKKVKFNDCDVVHRDPPTDNKVGNIG